MPMSSPKITTMFGLAFCAAAGTASPMARRSSTSEWRTMNTTSRMPWVTSEPLLSREGPAWSAARSPELVLVLLGAAVLAEAHRLPALHGPHVHLRRGPAAAAAPGALGTQHDHAIALFEHVVEPQIEAAIRELHEVREEAEHFVGTVVVARQGPAPRDMPRDVFREATHGSSHVPARKGLIGAADELGVRRCGSRHRVLLSGSHCAGPAGAPLEGSHPRLFRRQHPRDLVAAADAELAIGPREVAFDRLHRDV